MTVKLFEIFILLPSKKIYSATELFTLKLKPSFIKEVTTCFNLAYLDKSDMEGNLCFAEDKAVQPEYRTTFSKSDVLKNIFSQLSNETVNMEKDEIVFSENFFSS